MGFKFRKAERRQVKMRLGVDGPSGAGKTYSSLLIARGLVNSWSEVAVIDTENGSADLYSELGEYSVCTLEKPYTPEKYIEAIDAAEEAGFKVIIIDSLSHAWAGEGGLLDIHGKLVDSGKGNGFTAWRKVTPRHNALVERILHSKCHVIVTVRSKMEYVQQKDDNGKTEIKKVGMAPIFRDGLEYEVTVFMDLDLNHNASVSKDRTSLFDNQIFKPTVETGQKLRQWLESGAEPFANKQKVKVFYSEAKRVTGYDDLKLQEWCKKVTGKEHSAEWLESDLKKLNNALVDFKPDNKEGVA